MGCRRIATITGVDANMKLDMAESGVSGGALALASATASATATTSASSTSPSSASGTSFPSAVGGTTTFIAEARQAGQVFLNTYEDWWKTMSDLTPTTNGIEIYLGRASFGPRSTSSYRLHDERQGDVGEGRANLEV